MADRGEEILPRGVGVGMPREEQLYPGAKRRIAHQVVQLLQHRRRLVVDDGAVVALGLVEVGKRLPERRRAGGLVDAIGRRLVAQVEGLPRAAGGIEIGQRLGGEVGGKAFLQPEVVKPPHGHQVAEPLVGHLVQDRGEATELARQRGSLAEDELVLVVEDRTRVLHAAERKRGREHKIELLKRIRPREIALHPPEGAVIEREQRVEVGFLGREARTNTLTVRP